MSDRIEPNAATPVSTEPDRYDISECLKLLPKPTPVSIRKPGRYNYPTTWKDNKVPALVIGNLKDQWEDVTQKKWAERGVVSFGIETDDVQRELFVTVSRGPSDAKTDVEFRWVELADTHGVEVWGSNTDDTFITYHTAGHLIGAFKHYTKAVPSVQIEEYLEAGWMAKYAPEPPFGFNFNYKDRRKRFPGLCDTFTTDNPSADSHRFLELGQEIASSDIWSRGKWKPGDLIGPGGGDPATKAESASKVPHERWEEWQAGKDKRSITSIAHLHHHQRPAEAGVGWGGFDHLNRWQSYGRCVRLHMTTDQEFQRSPLAPMLFHDEKGEPANTVDAVFDPARYGRPSAIKTLKEAL